MLKQLLENAFGFSHFKPGQQAVVESILAGHSAAAIFPTGSGKSLCYQLSAVQLPHLTIVVSPLLALMQDQLAFLAQHGIAATSIDSSQSREQIQAVMADIRQGKIKILMVSVERFNNERFRQFIKAVPISLLVVDEAHCISEWGHNFRPDYLKLPGYQRELAIDQVLLLTATATAQVADDMRAKFNILPQHIVRTGFHRPNLALNVRGVATKDKFTQLTQWLHSRSQSSGIIYVTLQQSAETLTEQLKQAGFSACAYHAGLGHEVRQQLQQQFMQGEIPLMVATIAFGMGIDKSDIRFVVHYDLPKSIENYAQEVGRAGRDGQASECLVLANKDNLTVLENFVYGDTPEASAIESVLSRISRAQGQWETMLNSLSTETNIRPLALKTLLVYIELKGIIRPAYSYFAEHKFKFIDDKGAILNRFDPQRSAFLGQVFAAAKSARVWHSIDLKDIDSDYRQQQRGLTALSYLDEQNLIELQSKQMTQVYEVLTPQFDLDSVTKQLSEQFRDKEASEIARIHNLLNLLQTDQCLSVALASYFDDQQDIEPCGQCSACISGAAHIPEIDTLSPLASVNVASMAAELKAGLTKHYSDERLARALCGLHMPLFTKLKLRKVNGFGQLSDYPYAEVLHRVNTM